MDVHKNARTLAHSRALIAQRIAAGEPVAVVPRRNCQGTVFSAAAQRAVGSSLHGVSSRKQAALEAAAHALDGAP